MITNVRVLEKNIEKGLIEGRLLENAKTTLDKIKHQELRPNTWMLENNEGSLGTDIIIRKDGCIDICLCILEKYSSTASYVRVGHFQPHFELGSIYFADGKEKEYKKLGNIMNALVKEYEKYGFYFDTKNNRNILADARKAYIEEQNEIKMKKQEEEEVENLEEKPEPTPEPEKKSGFEVRVIEISTGDTVQVMSATNMRMAERIEYGVLMHLNREDYYVEIVDLSQSKTPEKEEITTEKRVERIEEKEMKTINKNGLNNKMVKLGEFLKENRDKDAIEKKVFELFPNVMEMQIFEDGDNEVYFLVGQDYIGKAPTKKEMKKVDYNFKEIDKVYGLSIYASIDTDKIEISANVAIDYTDEYGHYQYTDYTIKENVIEVDLTMEVAEEIVSKIRKKYECKVIDVTTAWDRLKKLAQRKSSDEVTDFLTGELNYFVEEEKKEELIKNTNDIELKICKIDALVQKGVMPESVAVNKLDSLFKIATTKELENIVDLAKKYIAVSKDKNIILPEKLQEILNRKYERVINKNIEKLEKINDVSDRGQAREVFSSLQDYKELENEYGFCFSGKILSMYRGKINVDDIDAPNGVSQVLRGREVVVGVDYKENKKATLYIKTRVEYLDSDGVVRVAIVYLYKKETDLTPKPEKDEESFPKFISTIKPDETTVYVLISPEETQVFWKYTDAYNKMVSSAKETAEEWTCDNELVIDKYGAKVGMLKWTIMKKNVQ